jgi:phage terminase large subunit
VSQAALTPDQAEYIRETYMPSPNTGIEPIPHLFVKDVLGCKTWQMQDEIVKSVFKYKITAVKTCNAVGKSYIAARIVLTYLMLYPGSIVVTTAPTWRQVTDVLWREIATAAKMSKFKLTTKEVNQAGLTLDTDWYAVGLSTKRPENFFGYHADNILVVVDEAGGVEEAIFKGVAAITPNINARVLLIGNPTTPGGTFYDMFTKPELGANCFTISAFDTPNFTANNIKTLEDLLAIFTPPLGVKQADHNTAMQKKLKMPFPNLIDPSVVYGRYFEWGTDSPAWESLIMGEFPSQADQALIPTNLVTMAMNMYGTDKDGNSYADMSGWRVPLGPPNYGQDMARFGSDASVNFKRMGGWVDEPVCWSKCDLMESAKRIMVIIQNDVLNEAMQFNIDDTGNGGGTTDRLREMSSDVYHSGEPAHQYGLNAYNFSSKEFMSEPDKVKFHDITSMLYWNLRQQFYNKAIALHYDKELFDQLVGRRWSIVPGGKIKVESKDEYKKRTGGKSPDKSDALALCFAPPTSGHWTEPEINTARPATRREGPIIAGQTSEQRHDALMSSGAPITSSIDDRY